MTGRTIIRAEHGEQPYFMLLRTVAQNTALSYESLGLLVYLLSKPNDWQVHPSALTRERTGNARVYKLLTELRQAGHVKRVIVRDDRQKFVRFEYVVHEQPLPESEREPFLEKPQMAKPQVEKPFVAKGHNTEYRDTQNTEETYRADEPKELPDHAPVSARNVIPLHPQPDGGALSYALLEAYCDAWNVTQQSYRDAWHKKHQRAANDLAALGATPEEVTAMVKERRALGKQPAEAPMVFLARDYVDWKMGKPEPKPVPAGYVSNGMGGYVPKPEVLARLAAEQEAEAEAWRKAQGLA